MMARRMLVLTALSGGALLAAPAGFAAEEVQVLRGAVAGAAMRFTTFQQEERAVQQALPCKWMSKDGRVGPSYGGERYDFLCKGGDFATVTLYLDKSGGDGVGGVRLMYRDWPANVNPNAAEATVAQQFLEHVSGRFVPAALAAEVQDAFWAQKNRSWDVAGEKIAYTFEKPNGARLYAVRKLEIKAVRQAAMSGGGGEGLFEGLGRKLERALTPENTGTVGFKPAAQEPDSGVTVTIETPVDAQTVSSTMGLTRVPTVVKAPVDATLRPVVPASVLVAPVKAPEALTPEEVERKALVVPQSAPASALKPATPEELNTAPAPESLVVPPPPPQPSATLVPTANDLVTGGVRAPSNFDVYNKAMELTRDVEQQAQVNKIDQPKVLPAAASPTSPAASSVVPPAKETAAPLKPIATPAVQGTAQGVSAVAPTTPVAVPPAVQAPVAAAPAAADTGLPTNYQGPASNDDRPLPQLKFVPKAQPVADPDQVIKFEDEKSAL